MHQQRGDTVCTNKLKIRRDRLEVMLLEGLQSAVLSEAAVDHAIRSMRDELERQFADLNNGIAKMRKRKAELEAEIARLIQALADGHGTQSIAKAIGDREQELRSIADTLLEQRPNSLHSSLETMRAFALGQLSRLHDLITEPESIHQARALLAQQIGKIALIPDGKGAYIAKGGIDFFGDASLRVRCAGGGRD